MLVIRVEHTDGNGMFRNSIAPVHEVDNYLMQNMWNRHSTWARGGGMPTPSNDNINIGKDDLDWYCAFRGLEEFNQWVYPEEAKKLIELGYRIYSLEVTNFQIGDKQVVYTKESIIEKNDLSDLFK